MTMYSFSNPSFKKYDVYPGNFLENHLIAKVKSLILQNSFISSKLEYSWGISRHNLLEPISLLYVDLGIAAKPVVPYFIASIKFFQAYDIYIHHILG